jgi:hypothetical protein
MGVGSSGLEDTAEYTYRQKVFIICYMSFRYIEIVYTSLTTFSGELWLL